MDLLQVYKCCIGISPAKVVTLCQCAMLQHIADVGADVSNYGNIVLVLKYSRYSIVGKVTGVHMWHMR